MTGPLLAAALLIPPASPPAVAAAEIRVVGAATGRGVPLVELETVDRVRIVTDNAGRAAFLEPESYGREVWLTLRGHGYSVPADGFGYRGVKVVPEPGRPAVVRVHRDVPAERVGRLTGAGRWRDSALLGHPTPPPPAAAVAGQDSVQAAVYRGSVRWFWGDTSRRAYPLGLFRTAAATTPVPTPTAGDDVLKNLRYRYLTGDDGAPRAAIPLPDRPEGVVWVDGLCVVPDDAGENRLVCHYSRRRGLAEQLDHGVAVWDDDAAVFRSATTLPNAETWRHPATHATPHSGGGTDWLLFGAPTPNVRVPATLSAVLNPARYEAFTPAAADGALPAGPPAWEWRSDRPPAGSRDERRWVEAGRLNPAAARFLPADAANPADRVTLHSGSVGWNAHRRKWVLIAGQIGGTSQLGEVWYAEADAPTGPFATAVKVATHDRQSFYNVARHPFLDADDGRVIYFEGTFTGDFSGNPAEVPRYGYNQLLYRLDLDAPELAAARARRAP